MLQKNQMVKALSAARKAVESAYNGVCTVLEYGDMFDDETKITYQGEKAVYENIPCKLSFEKLNAAVQTDTAACVSQGTKLFTAPEIKISGGSKIIVTQNGITGEYSSSGEPAVYPTHQEIMLELFRGWT